MDLLNNEVGIELAKSIEKNTTMDKIKDLCIEKIENGKAYFMKRDSEGNYLTCEGEKIDLKLYKNVWNLPKCLIQK